MNFLTAEQTAEFITKGKADIATIRAGFDILLQVPHLAREAFGHCTDLAKHFDDKVKVANYRTWHNTFYKATNENLLAVNNVDLHKLFHCEITAENVQKAEDLISNKADVSAVLTEWLSVVGLDQFKGSIKIEPDHNYNDRVNREALTADVLYFVGKLTGVDLEIKSLKGAVKNLSSMNNYKEFKEIGAELTLAKNGNITLKLPKTTVAVLNSVIQTKQAA